MRTISQITDYIIEEFLPDNSNTKIDPDLDLIETGIIDSLGFLRIVATIENTNDISIEPEELEQDNFRTIRSISLLIENKIAIME
jgi:acyl carrier protein